MTGLVCGETLWPADADYWQALSLFSTRPQQVLGKSDAKKIVILLEIFFSIRKNGHCTEKNSTFPEVFVTAS